MNNFKFLGTYQVTDIKKKLLSLPDQAWSKNMDDGSEVHKKAHHLFLKNDIRTEHFYGTKHSYYDSFLPKLKPLMEHIDKELGSTGHFIRIQFSKHLPGDGFLPHTDSFSKTLIDAHRVHVIINANKDIYFEVDGERKVFKEGEIWEINNAKVHAGQNHSQEDRINLILDYAKPFSSPKEYIEYFINLHRMYNGMGLLYFYPEEYFSSNSENVSKVYSMHIEITDNKTKKVIASNFAAESFQFVPHAGQIPPLLEESILSLNVDETKTFQLNLEKDYGPYLKEKVKLKEENPKQEYIIKEYGSLFRIQHTTNKGPVFLYNENHPFSLADASVRIKLISTRELEQEEIVFKGGYMA